MPRNLTALRHNLINNDTLSAEFCEILSLGEIFDPLIACKLQAIGGLAAPGGDAGVVCADFSKNANFTVFDTGITIRINGTPATITGEVQALLSDSGDPLMTDDFEVLVT